MTSEEYEDGSADRRIEISDGGASFVDTERSYLGCSSTHTSSVHKNVDLCWA